MTFREKVLWVTAAALILVWGAYFGDIVRMLVDQRIDVDAAFGGFVRSVILIVVIEVVASVAIAIASPREANARPDIREREFNLSAYRPAYLILAVVVAVTMLAAPALVHLAPALIDGDPAMVIAIVMGNAMLFGLVLSELVHSVWQIILYRRSA